MNPLTKKGKQQRKFEEAARELGVDPDANTEEVMRQLAKQKHVPRRKSGREETGDDDE